MLQQETFCDVNVRLTELRARRTANETAIEEVRRQRTVLISARVALSMSELTGRTFRQIQQEFPEFFLVREREAQFRAHRKILGFIKPYGYQRMLYLLQAQFHAYLEGSGICAAHDVRLRQLTERAAELNAQVLETEALRLRLLAETRPIQAAGQTPRRPATEAAASRADGSGRRNGTGNPWLRNALVPREYEPGYFDVDDGRDVLDVLDVLPLVVDAVISDVSPSDGQDQSGTCTPASIDQGVTIATDDSLGCFS